jgi:hypothetical protein
MDCSLSPDSVFVVFSTAALLWSSHCVMVVNCGFDSHAGKICRIYDSFN